MVFDEGQEVGEGWEVVGGLVGGEGVGFHGGSLVDVWGFSNRIIPLWSASQKCPKDGQAGVCLYVARSGRKAAAGDGFAKITYNLAVFS